MVGKLKKKNTDNKHYFPRSYQGKGKSVNMKIAVEGLSWWQAEVWWYWAAKGFAPKPNECLSTSHMRNAVGSASVSHKFCQTRFKKNFFWWIFTLCAVTEPCVVGESKAHWPCWVTSRPSYTSEQSQPRSASSHSGAMWSLSHVTHLQSLLFFWVPGKEVYQLNLTSGKAFGRLLRGLALLTWCDTRKKRVMMRSRVTWGRIEKQVLFMEV